MIRATDPGGKRRQKVELDAASSDPDALIAVGASAGGLQTLRTLIGQLPENLSASLIIAQHLAPNRDSRLDEIFRLSTRLPVKNIIDGQFPERGTIHVTPAGTDVLIEDGRLWLVPAPQRISPQPSIDRLLQSLASDCRFERKIGVILSGLGNDGAAGIRALQRSGGVCLAQSPFEAHAPDMPEAALETGCIDHAATAGEIGARLHRLTLPEAGEEDWPDGLLSDLDSACRQWEMFGTYRFEPALVTSSARLRQRLLALDDPESYVAKVNADPAEALALLRQLLRPLGRFGSAGPDRERLLTEVVGCYREWAEPRSFRVWNVGCALGEESYQIAMALEEARSRYGLKADYLIYGTDVLADAVSAARLGTYELAELTGLDADLQQKYFAPRLRNWQVNLDLRRRVIFAIHDALRDIPLPGVQFISCFGVMERLRPALAGTLAKRLGDSLPPSGRLVTD